MLQENTKKLEKECVSSVSLYLPLLTANNTELLAIEELLRKKCILSVSITFDNTDRKQPHIT